MRVASIDSAEVSGLAVIERAAGVDRLLWRAAPTIRTADDVTSAVHAIAAWSPVVVAVEEPFAHPRSPIAGMSLARLLGRWLQVLETVRLGVVTVPASMWQRAVLPGFNPRMRSAERKAAAQQLARERFGVEATEDEADAIALALYVARNATIVGKAPPS